MKCPKCQHINDATAKYCAECAAPLALACTRCGHHAPIDGEVLPAMRSTNRRQPRARRPGRRRIILPNTWPRKILRSRTALEGERKQVTVLFADLKASMELLADRDPEEARKLLDPVLELMMEAVHHYEGTVSTCYGRWHRCPVRRAACSRGPCHTGLLCGAAHARTHQADTPKMCCALMA